jgi:hypothetical protein
MKNIAVLQKPGSFENGASAGVQTMPKINHKEHGAYHEAHRASYLNGDVAKITFSAIVHGCPDNEIINSSESYTVALRFVRRQAGEKGPTPGPPRTGGLEKNGNPRSCFFLFLFRGSEESDLFS